MKKSEILKYCDIIWENRKTVAFFILNDKVYKAIYKSLDTRRPGHVAFALLDDMRVLCGNEVKENEIVCKKIVPAPNGKNTVETERVIDVTQTP